MPEPPVPLREALKEAIETLLDGYLDTNIAMDTGQRAEFAAAAKDREAAKDRVNALIEQIPIDLEAREGE